MLKRKFVFVCTVGIVVAIFIQSGHLAAEEPSNQMTSTPSATPTDTPTPTITPSMTPYDTPTPFSDTSFEKPTGTATPISQFEPTYVYNPDATPTTLPPNYYHEQGFPLPSAPVPDGITLYNDLQIGRIEARYTADCVPNQYDVRIFIRNFSPSFVGTFLVSIEDADGTLTDHYISQIAPYDWESVTIPLTLINGEMPTVLIDRTNLINEIDETNNRVENAQFDPPLTTCNTLTDAISPNGVQEEGVNPTSVTVHNQRSVNSGLSFILSAALIIVTIPTLNL